MFRKILVGTDGSDTATMAVAHALKLAEAIGAEVTAISVYATPQVDAPEILSARQGDPTADIARAILRDVQNRFSNSPSLTVRPVEGNPAEALLDLADEEGFDLIVVGNRGMAGASRLMLGNVPNKVSHHAPSSVLIVDTADGQEPGYRKMLAGTDGSATAARAVATAVELAEKTGAGLTIVTGAPNEQAGEQVLQPVRHEYPKVETVTLVGSPADAIVERAQKEGIDLIIVGNKGMTGARRFLLGSVPNKISHNAQTSVLIVNTTG
ncbi:MAG TPA: universal stress protein [Actinomycetota bacterium]|nr:universal stress protein [Actinomycetota bacterium]